MKDFMKLLSDAIGESMRDESRELSQAGWIQEGSGYWTRGTDYGARLQFDITSPDMERYYPGKGGHVHYFMIGYSAEEIHLLGEGGEQGHEYPAEVHEPTGKPFTINARPMKKEELEDFCQKFADGLRDFPDMARGSTIRQDLDGYRSHALQTLPQDWENYNSRQKI